MEQKGNTVASRSAAGIYALWAVLALPAIYLLLQRLVFGEKLAYLYWTGVISSLLLALALAITPLMLLFGPLPWLKARRRYFGVASFGYGVFHTAIWISNATQKSFLNSFVRFEVLVGWIALAIMVALAATSYDGAVRRLGPRWKALQRWVYPAAALVLLHWVLTTDQKDEAILLVVPVVVLEIYRVIRYRVRLAKR